MLPRFVVLGQAPHQRAQPRRVVDRGERAARLNHRVVPGRHHLAMLALARVPARRDIGLGPGEDHERLHRRVAPQRVGARDMAAQRAMRSFVRRELHRDQVGRRAVGRGDDERGQRPLAHQRDQRLAIGLLEMLGQVHRCEVSNHQAPTFGIDFHGSATGSAVPACSSSIEMLSGERTKAMRPSRGGRLTTTPWSARRWQVA